MDNYIVAAGDKATGRKTSLFLSVAQVAARYGVSTDTIWRWSRDGDLPKPVKLSPGCTRWRLSDLLEHEGQLSVGFVTSVLVQLKAA